LDDRSLSRGEKEATFSRFGEDEAPSSWEGFSESVPASLLFPHTFNSLKSSFISSNNSLTHRPTQILFRTYISSKIKSHVERFQQSSLSASNSPSISTPIPSSSTQYFSANTRNSSYSTFTSNLLLHFQLLSLPSTSNASEDLTKERNSLEEILLLVRKSREGIVASRDGVEREGKDEFVLDGEFLFDVSKSRSSR